MYVSCVVPTVMESQDSRDEKIKTKAWEGEKRSEEKRLSESLKPPN